MWADNETSQDLLGFKVHADLIQDVLKHRDLLPMTIGLFGDWGSGKTSVMQMLRDALGDDKNPGIACLYFNSWLFEGYDDAKAAIISSVLMQLGEHKKFGPKLRDGAVSLLKSVNWMRVARMGVQHVALPALSAYFTGGASLIPSLAGSAKALFTGGENNASPDIAAKEEIGSEKLDWESLIRKDGTNSEPLDVRTFRDRFEDLIEKSDIETLVILVDDLDRCSPERVLDNLEAIKLFLSVKKTAFVIGADPRIVRHAIAHRYRTQGVQQSESDTSAKGELVTDYLEKLIQVPYHLPRLSPSETQTYMALLFSQRDLSRELFSKCIDACNKQREKDRYSVFGYANIKEALGEDNIPGSLGADLVTCASIAPLVTEGLKGNPRQIKRFLNAIVLRKKLASTANLTDLRDDVLAKLMVLEYGQKETLFRQLFNWQAAQKGYPIEIAKLENSLIPPDGNPDDEEAVKKINPEWSGSFMRRWVVMEPHLKDVDLRDYFWVARDRLESTLSNVSLIAPIVRQILANLISGKTGRVQSACKLTAEQDEAQREVVVAHLGEHIRRHPDEKAGYDAARELMLQGVIEADRMLVSVLVDVPAAAIPPAVGLDFSSLSKSGSNMSAELKAVISNIGKGQSKAGAAIKKNFERKAK